MVAVREENRGSGPGPLGPDPAPCGRRIRINDKINARLARPCPLWATDQAAACRSASDVKASA